MKDKTKVLLEHEKIYTFQNNSMASKVLPRFLDYLQSLHVLTILAVSTGEKVPWNRMLDLIHRLFREG